MVSRISEKFGEFILLSLNSEKQLENSSHSKKKILDGCLKDLPSSEECIDMVSSLVMNSNSIMF